MTESATALPMLEPLEAPLADLTKDEMRERQRLHVKRTYYRKLNVLQTLRDDVSQLEKKYAQLLTQSRQNDGVVVVDTNTNANTNFHRTNHTNDYHNNANNQQTNNHKSQTLGAPRGAKQMQELYTEISQVKEALRAQNEAMRMALTEYQRYAAKLHSWVELERIATASNTQLSPLISTASSAHQHGDGVSPHTLATPITVDACHEVARTTFKDMQKFRENNDFITTGLSVFGWRDKRIRQGDRVKFSLKKMFHRITPLELSFRGWNILSKPMGLRSLYSSSMNVKIYEMQRVDEDNVVMFRVMTSHDARCLVKTLFVVSRFEIPTGFVILVHSLDKEKYLAPYTNPPSVEKEIWIDYYTWITFESTGGDGENGHHCKLDFGGEVQSNPVVGSDMWMLEVLLIALRWESHVVGPIFSIC